MTGPELSGNLAIVFHGLSSKDQGKTVKIRCGPAAVTGDESRVTPLSNRMGRTAIRMIRKSEDLTMNQDVGSSWTESLANGMKNGIPGD